jgi:hypothetical protein
MDSSGVVLQMGQEVYTRVHNATASTIPNGSVVYVSGTSDAHGHISVAPYLADGDSPTFTVVGVATHDIAAGADGYATYTGLVRGIDTSGITAGQPVYASASVAGGFTGVRPVSPNHVVVIGTCATSNATTGSIMVSLRPMPDAALVSYDNAESALEATNLQGAIDELQLMKADVSLLSSNITLYPTTAASDISTYYKLVDSLSDPDYDDTAANVSTGAVTGSGQLIASLASAPEVFVGDAGVLNISIVGNIRKTAGNNNDFAEFYFEVYKRTSGGTETLLGTSSSTGGINVTSYEQFSASAVVVTGSFSETDRVVTKFYGTLLGGTSATYDFQFGGSAPVRVLLPVPVSVIPSASASDIIVSTSNFGGAISLSADTVQKALDELDNITLIPSQTGNTDRVLSTTGSTLQWIDLQIIEGPAGPAGADGADAPTVTEIVAVTDNYNVTSADKNKLIRLTSSTAKTISFPTTTIDPTLEVGMALTIVQMGTGRITLAPGGSAIVYSTPGNKTRAQYSMASALYLGSNEWLVSGDLAV